MEQCVYLQVCLFVRCNVKRVFFLLFRHEINEGCIFFWNDYKIDTLPIRL